MKNLLFLSLFIVAALVSCNTTDEIESMEAVQPEPTFKDLSKIVAPEGVCSEKTVDLIASLPDDPATIGTVKVSNDDDGYLNVCFEATGDWVITEMHLYVGDPAEYPGNNNGNPNFGKFPYYAEGPTQSYCFTDDGLKVTMEEETYIIAHCKVQLLDPSTGDVLRKETAFGYVENWLEFTGKRWGGAFAYTPEYCDSDGDGVPDKDDDCPTEAGDAGLNGCPDRDGDGIPDKDDDCPDEAGPAGLNGCPDRDGDGIPDKDDDCPDEAGTADLNGCPEVPDEDRDGDGVPDKDDACPDDFGLQEFNGCPDGDGDGIPDNLDSCPTEPAPGTIDGCPVEPPPVEIISMRLNNGKAVCGAGIYVNQDTADGWSGLKKVVDVVKDVGHDCDTSNDVLCGTADPEGSYISYDRRARKWTFRVVTTGCEPIKTVSYWVGTDPNDWSLPGKRITKTITGEIYELLEEATNLELNLPDAIPADQTLYVIFLVND